MFRKALKSIDLIRSFYRNKFAVFDYPLEPTKQVLESAYGRTNVHTSPAIIFHVSFEQFPEQQSITWGFSFTRFYKSVTDVT